MDTADTKTGEDSRQGAVAPVGHEHYGHEMPDAEIDKLFKGVLRELVVLHGKLATPDCWDCEACGFQNYAALLSVLMDALDQAAAGKGRERHANDDPFERQSICEITRKHGLAFATGQAAKKLEESHRLLQLRGAEAAINEILGAINYAAAAVIVLREGEAK